jgi:hypothetical protein
MTTTTQTLRPWTHRKVDDWWCVYDSQRALLAKFIIEGHALVYIEMAHRGRIPRQCPTCTAGVSEVAS